MKSKYKTLFMHLVVCSTLLFLASCDDTRNSKESVIANNNTSSVNQQSPKTNLEFFDLPDTVIKVTSSKPLKVCFPISRDTTQSNFSAATTKAPQHGNLTPSVSGNVLCFDYVPNAAYSGTDQFDCKVCFVSSGFCQEKTWRIEIFNNSETKSIPPSTALKSPRTSVKKKEETQEIAPTVLPARSSIFDADKKNNDGYVPKN